MQTVMRWMEEQVLVSAGLNMSEIQGAAILSEADVAGLVGTKGIVRFPAETAKHISGMREAARLGKPPTSGT